MTTPKTSDLILSFVLYNCFMFKEVSFNKRHLAKKKKKKKFRETAIIVDRKESINRAGHQNRKAADF